MDFFSFFKAYINQHCSDLCVLCLSLFAVTDQPDGVELTQHRGRPRQSARDDRERQSKEQEYDKQIRDLQQRLQVSDGQIQEIQEQKQELVSEQLRRKTVLLRARRSRFKN